MTAAPVCGCRCHGGQPVAIGNKCCPECEPGAYDLCEACGAHRYQHEPDEREGSPGACEVFHGTPGEVERATKAALEAAGQQRLVP